MGYIYATSSFVQEGEPADLSEGNLWYSTIDKKLYVSDGISYSEVSIETDLIPVFKKIGLTHLNILELNASALVDFSYESIVSDIMTDSNGLKDTINTTSTTGIFDTDEYNNINPPLESNCCAYSGGAGAGRWNHYEKAQIIFKNDCIVKKFKRRAQPKDRYILRKDGATVSSGAMDSEINLSLLAGTYEIEMYCSYDHHDTVYVGFGSYDDSRVTITKVTDAGRMYGLYGIDFLVDPSDKDLVINQINTDGTYTQLLILPDYEVAGTGSLGLTINNDVHVIEEFIDKQATNYDIVFKLNGSGQGNTCKLRGYVVLMFK